MIKKLMFNYNTLTALTALFIFFLFSGSSVIAQTASIGGTVRIAVCGNNEKQGEQTCDNSDLDGKTCQDFGYKYGELKCGIACDRFTFSQCYNDISELKQEADCSTKNATADNYSKEKIFKLIYNQLLIGLISIY